MSYDLAVWEGDRPPTDTEALDMFEHLYDGIRRAHDADTPHSAIRRRTALPLA